MKAIKRNEYRLDSDEVIGRDIVARALMDSLMGMDNAVDAATGKLYKLYYALAEAAMATDYFACTVTFANGDRASVAITVRAESIIISVSDQR